MERQPMAVRECVRCAWGQGTSPLSMPRLQRSSSSEGGHTAKTTWTVARGQLAAPWWQCTLSPSSRNASVSRPQQRYHISSFALFTRFGPLRLLPLLEDGAAAKVSPLWQSGGDPAAIAECPWYASRTGLPAVATALGSTCRCTRGLFWRVAVKTWIK
jgi:hypothetical protein